MDHTKFTSVISLHILAFSASVTLLDIPSNIFLLLNEKYFEFCCREMTFFFYSFLLSALWTWRFRAGLKASPNTNQLWLDDCHVSTYTHKYREKQFTNLLWVLFGLASANIYTQFYSKMKNYNCVYLSNLDRHNIYIWNNCVEYSISSLEQATGQIWTYAKGQRLYAKGHGVYFWHLF